MERIIDSVFMEPEDHGYRITWQLLESPRVLVEGDVTYLALRVKIPGRPGEAHTEWGVKFYHSDVESAYVTSWVPMMTNANYDPANIEVDGRSVSASYPDSSLGVIGPGRTVYAESSLDGIDIDSDVPVTLLV